MGRAWVSEGGDKGLSAAEHAVEQVRRAAHKDFGLSLFSTMNELQGLAEK
jgi:hypothetical protein